ncbi:MAG TPA: hypothetical protein VKP88_02120 [Candidatus Paceibacterota bacterium]|nr:hypothetical protein [Candidatus Paceibacterota bacterium]
MAPKNLAKARFTAARRRNRKDQKNLRIHTISFHEVSFFFAGERHYFGYDDSRRCVYRLSAVLRYPYLTPEDAADLYDEAEMIFLALRRSAAIRAARKTKEKSVPSRQLELPL